jgi:hypothetical protein
MELQQKRLGNVHTFTFGETHLTFRYKDRKGEGEFEVAYSEVPEKHSVVIEANDWLRNVGLLWCAIGGLQVALALGRNGSVAGSGFWLIIGLACLAAHYLRKVRYSVFKTSEGTIFVIQDKDHDALVGEMSKRRRAQLVAWYGEINPENSPEREIEKFKWLEKEGALTPQEAAARISQIKVRAGARPGSDARLAN